MYYKLRYNFNKFNKNRLKNQKNIVNILLKNIKFIY